jgi:hypothetical protein
MATTQERPFRIVQRALLFCALASVLVREPGYAAAAKLRYPQQKAITAVNCAFASQLDPKLPRVPFGPWLAATLGVKKVPWSVQVGCGDPNNARPRDVCVVADVLIARTVSIGVVMRVGTANHLERPSVDLLYSEAPDRSGYNEIRSLHELAEFTQDFVVPAAKQ